MALRKDTEQLVKLTIEQLMASDHREFGTEYKLSDVYDKLGVILSDVRDGTDKHLARYDAANLKEYYPVGQDANVLHAAAMGFIQATAVAPDVPFQPAVGEIYDVYGFSYQASALAAAREFDVYVFDGTLNVLLWASGAGAIATGTAFTIWPIDFTGIMLAGIGMVGVPPLRLTSAQYLFLDTTGLAAAETIDLYIHFIRRQIGGLRT